MWALQRQHATALQTEQGVCPAGGQARPTFLSTVMAASAEAVWLNTFFTASVVHVMDGKTDWGVLKACEQGWATQRNTWRAVVTFTAVEISEGSCRLAYLS